MRKSISLTGLGFRVFRETTPVAGLIQDGSRKRAKSSSSRVSSFNRSVLPQTRGVAAAAPGKRKF